MLIVDIKLRRQRWKCSWTSLSCYAVFDIWPISGCIYLYLNISFVQTVHVCSILSYAACLLLAFPTMKFWQESHPISIPEKHADSALTEVPERLSDGWDGKVETRNIQPGNLDLEEDAAGGLGRHLGLFSTTLLMLVHPSN